MKRLELLQSEENKSKDLSLIANQELRDFNKKLTDLKYELEVAEEELAVRMGDDTKVDYSTVVNNFNRINKIKQQIAELDSFISIYYAS